MAWWKEMQPGWRYDATDGTLKRNAPADENSLILLKKGGTAGLYIVVVGLSWWVKAQTTGRSNGINAWSAVADLSWVFRQITEVNSPGNSSQKRARDDDKEESQPKKRFVIPVA